MSLTIDFGLKRFYTSKLRVRKENLARAIEHESNGNSAAAYECYQKAVDISPSIACELIQVGKCFYETRSANTAGPDTSLLDTI